MTEFFHMGGYAAYVWSSYGLAFIVLLPTLLLPILENKRLRKKLKGKYRRENSELLSKQVDNQENQNKDIQ